MKQPRHIAVGIDPAAREYGFVISTRFLQEKTLQFQAFKKFSQFLVWAQQYSLKYSSELYTVSIGIENSRLVKKYFGVEDYFGTTDKKRFDECIFKVGSVGINQGVSDCAAQVCKLFFGAKNVFEFRPLPFGKMTTGGKKSHVIFEGSVRTYGLTVTGYPDIKKNRNKITRTVDQDMRDAFYCGEYGLQAWKDLMRANAFQIKRKKS